MRDRDRRRKRNEQGEPHPPQSTRDEARVRDTGDLPDTAGPPLKDPRSQSAIDNIGVDDQGDLLDVELDDELGDIDAERQVVRRRCAQ